MTNLRMMLTGREVSKANNLKQLSERGSTKVQVNPRIGSSTARLPLVYGSMKSHIWKYTAMLLMLLTLGVGQMWGYDVQKNAIIYMNNSASNWSYSNIYFCIDDNYGYSVSPVTNTKLLVHKRTDNTWSGYGYIRFFGANGSWGDPASLGGYQNMYDYGANLSNTKNNYTFNANNYYVIKLSKAGSKDSQATLSVTNPGSTIASMNNTMTIKAKISTDGGSTYSQGNTPGELTADSYEFTAYNSCSSATSATVSAGSASSTLSVGYTANLTLEAADVEGYDFIGWSSGTNASTNVGTTNSVTVNPISATTYYAWYREKRYQIKALTPSPTAGGSSNSPSSWTYAGQISGGSISVSTNTGYDFTGWTINSGSGTFADASATSTTFYPTAESELRPNFATKTITVTLDGNEGSGGTATVKYNASSLTSISHASRAGYSLNGYFTASSGGSKVISADGSLNNVSGWVSGGYWIKATNGTLYAQWTENIVNYAVTYDVHSSGHGTLAAANTSTSAAISSGDEVVNGTGVTFTASPSTGYTVDGWFSNEACTSPIAGAGSGTTYSTTITAATSVYVKFKEKTWSVAFAAGTGGSVTTPAATPQTVGQITGISIEATPNTGYGFSSWTISSGSGSFTSAVTTNSNTFKPTAASTITASFYVLAPTGLAASSTTAKGTTLTVTDATNANNYEFYVSTSSTAPTSGTSATHTVSGGKSKTITDLYAGTTFYAWVRSNRSGTKSAWTALTGSTFTTSTVSVTHTLTNVTKTSGETSEVGGSAYTAVYSANTDYSMPTPTVTIGGAAKTSDTDYTWTAGTGTISIPANKINGDIVITLNSAPSAPTNVAISGAYHYYPGETISLTATATGGNGPKTYQWYHGGKADGNAISGARSATFSKTCAAGDAGDYYCKVTCGGSASRFSDGGSQVAYQVKVMQFYLKNSSGSDISNHALSKVDDTHATLSLSLTGGTTYKFRVTDGCGNWYGNTGEMTSSNCTNWHMDADADCRVTTNSKSATYTFNFDFSSGLLGSQMYVSVVYPAGNQPSGKIIYWDNSVLNWADGKQWYRIGKVSHNTKTLMTKVPGTANLYEITTAEYNGFEYWHIANNDGNGTGNIFWTKGDDAHAITHAMSFEGSPVTESAVTVTPGTDHSTGGSSDNNNCEFYSYTITTGMKTDRVTISPYSNGTITVNYTNTSNTASTLTSGYADLAHTVILTSITAVANTGYDASAITINGGAYSANYVVTGATTVAASFTPQEYSITYKDQGDVAFTGVHGSGYPTTHTYASATALVSPTKTGYTFGGWYTTSNCTGAAVTSLGATAYTADITLYAKWTANPYTITLNNQSATTAGTTSISVTFDANTNLSGTPAITRPTKTNYAFGGYYTDTGGSGVQIIDAGGNVVAGASGGGNTYTDASKKWKCASNITLYAYWIEAVASVTVGGATTYYATVADAITAANELTSPTVTMLKNTTTTQQTITAAMTINLNGKTITSTEATDGKAVFVVSASGKTVTIRDSSTGGTIAHTATVSGTVRGIELSLGTLAITGGTIRATNNVSSGNSNHRAYGIFASGTTAITISGGTVEAMCPNNPTPFGIYALGNLTMTGGTVNAEGTGLVRGIYVKGTTSLTNATVTATATAEGGCAIFAKSGNLTINSGTYSATGIGDAYTILYEAGSVTVNGGRLNGTTQELKEREGASYGSNVHLSGGYYVHSTDLAANCAANYYVFDLAAQSPYLYEVAQGYTLTWDLDGGSVSSAGTAAGIVKVGTTLTAPTVTRTGYTFSAWSPSVAASMPSANATYTATWSPVTLHFTTAGNWSVAANWTPACVPTIAHPVVLEKEATVNVTDARAASVVIDQSSTKTGRLIVEPGQELVIATTLRKTTDGSTMIPTGENDVVINSTSILGLGALVMGSHDGTNKATVNFYTRSNGKTDANTSVGQYVGTPFSDETNILYNWYNSWVYGITYSGSGVIGWERVEEGHGMTPFRGYCVFSADAWGNAGGHSYWQQGTLNASENVTCSDLNWQSGVGSANQNNENLLANSWMAPIKISAMESSDFTNADATVYIFNSTSNSAYTSLAGNYDTHSINTSEAVIPAMQSFSVFTKGSSASVKMDYNKIVYTPAVGGTAAPTANSAPARYSSTKAEADKMRLIVRTESGSGDMLYMWEHADFAEGFENGWDGRKLFGESYAPQLYAITPDGYMAINCVQDWEGTVIGFRAGSEDQMYTFAFEYEGDGTWYLNDLKAEQSTLITPENTYTFMAWGDDSEARFLISRTPINYVPTEIENSDISDQKSDVKKIILDDHVFIIRGGRMYDVTGVLMH